MVEKGNNNFNGSLEQKRMEAEKRKNIPNGAVFATVNGVTAMHLLDRVELHVGDFNGTVGEFITKVQENDIIRKQEFEKYKEEVSARFNNLEVAKTLD